MTITQQYESLLKKFKPEFGNTTHIYIVEMIGVLNKEKASLAQKKKEDKNTKKLEQKIQDMRRKLIVRLTALSQ